MDKLKQILTQEDTVLFIGSGISLWSGLPSWTKLIEELAVFIEQEGGNADLVRQEARRGDLLQAASYGLYRLTQPQIAQFFQVACRRGTARPDAIHRKIVTFGARCFITTNYDELIEESLRQWRAATPFKIVTNRQLIEMANIIGAHAKDFVFKPHGDVGDAESIILTREQYRHLLPGGGRVAALESVKTLLLSRSVVYLGFGLRDPDFVYLRDILTNIYKGGVRDHYAIMADVQAEEIEYWRREYGIHLIGYTTILDPISGIRNHNPLLTLLEDLAESPRDTISKGVAELRLLLARYAGPLTRFLKRTPEFPIRVHVEQHRTRMFTSIYTLDAFDHCPVERFLKEGPTRALLIGLPGAGKSYSLRRAAAELAEKLTETCLAENFEEKEIVIPIFVDLKLYDGSLFELIEQTLPNGLLLSELKGRFRLKLFLDSFNEMPREHWESNKYEEDFLGVLEELEGASFIIGSRTTDGLSKFDFPVYNLDQIEKEFVEAQLRKEQKRFQGRFEDDILSLLQKPFYFYLYITGNVVFSEEPHPRDFFQSLFNNLRKEFELHFNVSLDLENALSLVAYEAINTGEEAQLLDDILKVLGEQLRHLSADKHDPLDIANWLASKSILIPYKGSRVAFFHQSVTEFLASSELARLYQASPSILSEKLSLMRWDQALFLTLSLLPPEKSAQFLAAIIDVDFSLALKATKYLEFERDEVIAKMLAEIPGKVSGGFEGDNKIAHALEYYLPVNSSHKHLLRQIIALGDSIGGSAVECLVRLEGPSVKDELLQSLFDHRDDYNFCCNGVAPAIGRFIKDGDLDVLIRFADIIEHESTPGLDDKSRHGFTCSMGALLENIELASIRKAFFPADASAAIPEIRAEILSSILQPRQTADAMELAGELLLRGYAKAATTMHFIANHSETEMATLWRSFSGRHAEALISHLHIAHKEHETVWALKSLKQLCEARPDLAEIVSAQALSENGLLKTALLYCVSQTGEASVYETLRSLAQMDKEQRSREPIHLLAEMELKWAGREELLVDLLKLRDRNLARGLIEFYPWSEHFGNLEIGPIYWWLDWLSESQGDWWLLDRLSSLFRNHLTPDARTAFLAEFNKPDSTYRPILAISVLRARNDLTTDHFTEETISYLISTLNTNQHRDFRGHLLGHTATESFVEERLLPMLGKDDEPLASNLREILSQAGGRHGRRYIPSR